ncbi:MAG TPA: MBL fold metallo-hydrolase [Thermoanaerobaculia bacterium]
MKRLLRVLAIILLILGAVAAVVRLKLWRPLGGRATGERLARIRSSPQWNGRKFENRVPTTTLLPGSFVKMLRQQYSGDQERVPKSPIPIVNLTAADLAQRPPTGLRATWIGHATALLEIDGHKVLTDPIWSERCSPVGFAGPKRFHAPPISLAELGRVDAVVISHDHYDHLDMDTVRSLAANGTVFAVGLGIGAHLEKWGIKPEQIRELDWGEEARVGMLTLTSLPARHYSGRDVFDGDKTLWSSWSIRGPRHRVYFSGDTGYFDAMKDLGTQYGPFDLSVIKIGAYGDTWPHIHVTPEEAVKTHVAVGAKVLLPVHWGTFNLSYHDWFEPPERLLAAAAAARITTMVPRPGEQVNVPSAAYPAATWWR